MTSLNFTAAQKSLIQARTSTYVEACPGAGKTEAIVQRFIERPFVHPRKGIGLISFTRTAIDEARERCASTPTFKETPNFIGTIDSFINRFLVGPTFLARRGIAPRFYESWSVLPGTHVQVRGVPVRASLDWFAIDGLTAHLVPERAPFERRFKLRNLSPQHQSRLEIEAQSIWSNFVRRGILSASASRVAMRNYLQDRQRRDQLGQLLANRFSEVIVDEVQDCGADDVRVLELLHEYGVRIIAVGDPDQSIYGFRTDAPTTVSSFLKRLTRGARLNGNFRSSPAICAAVNSLRCGDERDTSVGQYSNVDKPVMLVSYSRSSLLPMIFTKILTEHGIPHNDLVVVAHSAQHARAAAGSPSKGGETSNRLVLMADAHHAINDSRRSSHERVTAMRTLERTIRELGVPEVADMDYPDYFNACGLSERTFREACLRIATALPRPFSMKPADFRAGLAGLIESQRQLQWTPARLKTPNGNNWPYSAPPDSEFSALRYSTIHGLKGRQAPAIALVLPRRRGDCDGVDQWSEGLNGEERRVLYVGASRAERVLILAAHESVFDVVKAQTEKDGVPTKFI